MLFKVSTVSVLLCFVVFPVNAFAIKDSTTDSDEPSCNVTLDFSRKNFDKVYTFISSLFVKGLNFSHNEIKNVDEGAFDNVPNLAELDLSFNEIPTTQLFSFGSLPKLRTLILNDNKEILPEISTTTEYYHQLGSYYYDRHGYHYKTPPSPTTTTENPEHLTARKTISINGIYPDLENLYLQNVEVRKLSTKNWVALLPKLSTLDVSRNPHLDFQDFMSNFPPSIKNLYTSNNGISFMNLTGIHTLEILILDSNRFNNLYITDNSTNCELENQLCIGWSKALATLSASNCGIEQFTIEYDLLDPLPNLKILGLSGNKLKNLGDLQTTSGNLPKLSSLQKLSLTMNSFESIQNLCSLKNLSVLYMNSIPAQQALLTLDEDIEECLPSLREFYFAKNHLKEMPKKFLNNLKKLEKLDLSDNQLKKFPAVLKTLKELVLVNNRIANFDDLDLEEMEALELLNVGGNPLRSFKVGQIKKFPDTTKIMIQ